MSDMGEDFRAMKEASREKKANNLASSTDILKKARVNFTSHNNGVHLVIQHSDRLIDFWPSTGKWNVRSANLWGLGVFALLKVLGVQK